MSFTDAVEQIMGRAAVVPSYPTHRVAQSKPKSFIPPPVSRDTSRMVNYLRGRGIDFDILHFCMDTGRLYESHPFHNAVFVGMDESGTPRYAALRGANFMGEAAGSDKHYSFGIPAKMDSDTLYLFESPTDLMSYATLLKMGGQDWRQDHLLSLSGVYQPRENAGETTTPAALERYLENNPNIRNIVLCFDNDRTGRLAVDTIRAVLPSSYHITDQPPPYGKDYNDYLCDRLHLPRTKPKEQAR